MPDELRLDVTTDELRLVKMLIEDYMEEDFLAEDLIPAAEGLLRKIEEHLPATAAGRGGGARKGARRPVKG